MMMSWRKKMLPVMAMIVFLGMPYQAAALTEKGFEKLHVFSTVLHYIEDNYVEGVDEQRLIRGAIEGMMGTLDPHSAYMTPEVYRELKVDTRGRFDGIGIEVTVRDNALTVVTPIKGSPAERSGIQAGDRILKIDGKSTEGMSLSEAVRAMRGKRGSKVHLVLKQSEEKKEYDVTMVRQVIHVPSIKSERLDDHYGYFSISSFQQDTAKSLRRAIASLSKQTSLAGIILDLRRNPGGLLEEAVKVVDMFLKEGVIVTTESRGQEIDRREASADGTEFDFPMIVMVDGGSASASEIVAGALQDHKRAVILGTQTFGKGSVQTVIDLDDGSGLKLTVARYFTPSGRSIQASGITPEILVPAKVEDADKKRNRIREKDLQGHLKGENEKADEEETKTAPEDYQKTVALNYLKSWSVFQHNRLENGGVAESETSDGQE